MKLNLLLDLFVGNAVWLDKVTAARALMKLSLSYEVAMERQRATEKKKKLAIKTKDLEGIKNNTGKSFKFIV